MDQIDPDALYDERADVSRARPLLQGDIFNGVVLPGFGDDPRKVQIVAHPCAMRTGASFAHRITVAPVEAYQVVSGTAWDRHPRVMPLAELASGKHFAAKFVDITACPVELLTKNRRIATLSNRGIFVLQQRLIKHYTRVETELEVLRSQSAPVLTEAELLWDWLETVCLRLGYQRRRHSRHRGRRVRKVDAQRVPLTSRTPASRNQPCRCP